MENLKIILELFGGLILVFSTGRLLDRLLRLDKSTGNNQKNKKDDYENKD